MDNLPFLYFPNAIAKPFKGSGGGSSPHVPAKPTQVSRITPQLDDIQATFEKITTFSQQANSGLEPETVLVMEIAGSIQDFKQALEAVGFEWLAEWDEDDLEPDDNFYWVTDKGEKSKRKVASKLFVSMANQSALQQLLALWYRWCREEGFERGTSKWKDLFSQLLNIRVWGPEESLYQTGMMDRWQDLLEPISPEERIKFQIDFFYRNNTTHRKQLVEQINSLLITLEGSVLNSCEIQSIRFHAIKAELPAHAIKQLLEALENNRLENDISLFNFPGIMYFKPTGQSISKSLAVEPEEICAISESKATEPSLALLLDGLPLAGHSALDGHLIVDDLFELDQHYQIGEQLHGTSMASLILHGDLNSSPAINLNNSLICIPIMQPNPDARTMGNINEYVPDEEFIEERVLKAIEYIVSHKNETEVYQKVCFINFSIGVGDQVFHSTLSPLARLIDWLSYTYNLLFFVSAGNYIAPIDLGMPYSDWQSLDADKQAKQIFQLTENSRQAKRVLSPAESINSLTVGGYHADEYGSYKEANRIDPFNDKPFPSLISRIGHGFKQAVKPEIYFPAGRQLYKAPLLDSAKELYLSTTYNEPGHKVALPSKTQGDVNKVGYTRGTSNATALATHSAQVIYNHLNTLAEGGHKKVSDDFIPVVVKALITHAAKQPQGAKKLFSQVENSNSKKKFNKQDNARYLGYGNVDINWLLRNTQQRATVIGWDEIGSRQLHEYRFPLPTALSNRKDWRRVVITLAWFSPINSNHAGLREAKLEVKPANTKWGKEPLKLARTEQDHNRVRKGTVQHEVLESTSAIAAYQEGEELVLQVNCMPDATSHLDETIRYCLAVTLEVKQETKLPIYQQIQQQIQQPVRVGVKP